jgi:glucose/arabinose dehydrogenase
MMRVLGGGCLAAAKEESMRTFVAAVVALLLGSWVGATQAEDGVRTGAAAYGDWSTDAPGVRRLITPADLPPAYATPSAADPSHRVARTPSQLPIAPPGFAVDLFAEGLSAPRAIRTAPNGDIFVVESGAGRVLLFGADGKARGETFVEGLERPFGLAFYPSGREPRFVYIATPGSIVRFPYRSGDLKPSGPAEPIAALPPGGSHWTRDIVFSPDDGTMFVSVGSASNDAQGMPNLDAAEAAKLPLGASSGDERERADVLAFNPDGGAKRVYATGMRNCAGVAIQPATGALWCAVNERDRLGDDLPPDYVTRVSAGQFFGWPWRYIGDNPDPHHQGERADLAGRVTLPDVLFQAHSAPLGIAFYQGGQFPAEYVGDAFVAMHGSWNRAKRTGYKVVRLLMKDGKPTGVYEDFLIGFVADDKSVWGRPVDVAVTKDGALLVTDDLGGAIWRVRWAGK